MRNILLSLVIIAVLIAGGTRGILATWSDSETSAGNMIETGSLDLMVNGADDEPWGAGVLPKVDIACIIPCKVYGPFEVELWNAGQDCMPAAEAFVHIKDFRIGNADPKLGSGYSDPFTLDMKPEPELVAEYGGKVNCVLVDGVGRVGKECSLRSHVRMWMTDDPTLVPDIATPIPDPRFLIDDKMVNLVSREIPLGQLQACQPQTFWMWFHLQQPSEEDFGFDYIPDPGEVDYDELYWKKFNDWPSWALMKDWAMFDMEFDLYLADP